MIIELTQYMLPDGRKQDVSTEIPDRLADKVERIEAAGFWFEAEVLTTGHVSLTITNEDADHAFSVTENGPAVQAGLEKMIEEFDPEAVEAMP